LFIPWLKFGLAMMLVPSTMETVVYGSALYGFAVVQFTSLDVGLRLLVPEKKIQSGVKYTCAQWR
jgi:hypothetical protein